MRAAWYESQGEARNVLVVGTMEDPLPGSGELRIEVQRSGINPGDVKKRSIVPHYFVNQNLPCNYKSPIG